MQQPAVSDGAEDGSCLGIAQLDEIHKDSEPSELGPGSSEPLWAERHL